MGKITKDFVGNLRKYIEYVLKEIGYECCYIDESIFTKIRNYTLSKEECEKIWDLYTEEGEVLLEGYRNGVYTEGDVIGYILDLPYMLDKTIEIITEKGEAK